MEIEIVNYEEALGYSGILTKYAKKMNEALLALGEESFITSRPSGKADVAHHVNYYSYIPSGTIDTLQITHITTPAKLKNVRKGMETAALGICFSKETEDYLTAQGIKNLTTILPAHDEYPRKKKRICITTNVYPDGCKREWMFYELLKNIDRSKFHFYIMGSGWNVDGLNMTVIDHFDKKDYTEILNKCEYNLYFGKDEGSMGVLDAKQAGLRIIAPISGFHKEIGVEHPFDTQEELNAIFQQLEYNPVEDWTWNNYCKQHLKLWKKL